MSKLSELAIDLAEVPSIRPLNSSTTTNERIKDKQRIDGKFLRGPIPWSWLTKAAQLPGATLSLGIVIWHLNGFQRTGTVKLKPSAAREMGMDRHAAYRALKQLESAGLVCVNRRRGASPLVTLVR